MTATALYLLTFLASSVMSVEIQELTYIIKHDIAELNKQISQLQNIAKY